MSVPVNQAGEYVSSLLMAAHFLPPDDRENGYLLDFEQGGLGLNFPDEGLDNIPWTLRYYSDTGDVVVESETTPPTILFTRSGLTEISLAWDQNMNPFVAFVENGNAKFWWYDSDIPATVFSNLPAGSLTPRCCLDDKRQSQTLASDIILCYVHAGALKMRIERERYITEHIVESPFLHPQTGNPAVLKRVGMNQIGRLQWLCTDPTVKERCP